jgi:hypothetical protein
MHVTGVIATYGSGAVLGHVIRINIITQVPVGHPAGPGRARMQQDAKPDQRKAQEFQYVARALRQDHPSLLIPTDSGKGTTAKPLVNQSYSTTSGGRNKAFWLPEHDHLAGTAKAAGFEPQDADARCHAVTGAVPAVPAPVV